MRLWREFSDRARQVVTASGGLWASFRDPASPKLPRWENLVALLGYKLRFQGDLGDSVEGCGWREPAAGTAIRAHFANTDHIPPREVMVIISRRGRPRCFIYCRSQPKAATRAIINGHGLRVFCVQAVLHRGVEPIRADRVGP